MNFYGQVSKLGRSWKLSIVLVSVGVISNLFYLGEVEVFSCVNVPHK